MDESQNEIFFLIEGEPSNIIKYEQPESLQNDLSNIIVFDGFVYTVKSVSNGIKYLQCASQLLSTNSVQLFCGGRATMPINSDKVTIDLSLPHVHGPDPHLIQKTIFIKELKTRVVQQTGTIKSIYDQTCLDFPNASSLVAFQTIEPTLRRVRATTQPPNPTSLLQVGEILSDPQWKRFSQTLNGNQFYSTTLEATDGSIAVIFVNLDLISRFNLPTSLYMDCTYIIDPPILEGKYLFSCHCTMYKQSHAVYYGLLSKRTQRCYETILTHLRTIAIDLNPDVLILDYSVDLYNAAKDAYPDVPIQFSYLTFVNYVYQKLSNLGISNQVNEPKIKTITRMINALPLLPSDKIGIGLNIIDRISKTILVSSLHNKLMKYLDQTWWYGVAPPLLSVFNKQEATNTNINIFQRTIAERFCQLKNIWNFIEKLKECECLAYRDFELLKNGHSIVRERKTKLLSQDDRLGRTWNMMHSKRLYTGQFFERVTDYLASLEQQLEFFIIVDYDEFVVPLIKGDEIIPGLQKVNRKFIPDDSNRSETDKILKRKSDKQAKTSYYYKKKAIKKDDNQETVHLSPVREGICLVCKDDDWEARCILKPCGHKSFCTVCVTKLVNEKIRCPRCKKIPNGFEEPV